MRGSIEGGVSSVRAWGMLPTPFTWDREVDLVSLERLVRHLRRSGCDGFIAFGAIAEPVTLTASEKSDIVRSIAAAAEGAPVVGSSVRVDVDGHVADFHELDRDSRARLDAVMVPVTSTDPRSVSSTICGANEVSGLPVILQDLPRWTGVEIGVEALVAAVDSSPSCIAVKCEASPTYERISALSRRTGVTPISGLGGLGVVNDVIAGARAVAVGSTATAEVVAATTLALRGRYDEAIATIGAVAARIHHETQPGANIAIRKRHWEMAGVIDTHEVRNPTAPFRPDLEPHSAVLSHRRVIR